MRDEIDELAKNLASGMPRRKALWRFLVAAGALLTGSSAFGTVGFKSREHQKLCDLFCRAQLLEGPDYEACMEASADCPEGQCAIVANGGGVGLCVALTSKAS